MGKISHTASRFILCPVLGFMGAILELGRSHVNHGGWVSEGAKAAEVGHSLSRGSERRLETVPKPFASQQNEPAPLKRLTDQ